MSFLSWLTGSARDDEEFRRKLAEVKRDLNNVKPLIDKLARGGYSGMTNEEISREINGRGRR